MGLLDAELEHAGEETALSPKMMLLEQLRITPEKQLKPMEFLFYLYGKPCFPKRELVAITGKAKSGKTFVTSMLMAVGSLTPDPSPRGEGNIYQLPLKRMREEPLHVLWYDTEQSDESTQDILKNRILKMTNLTTTDLTDSTDDLTTNCTNLAAQPEKNPLNLWPKDNSCSKEKSVSSVQSVFEKQIDVFNVRAVEWKQRRALLTEAVRRCKPDLVIVDGIRDLVNDINDGVLAQEVMEELMHLATEHDCCIVCVLHQNKSGEDHNLRGWIGTELMNKAFEVYSCEKLLPQRIFSLEQTLTRKYDIEQTMYFEVGDDGLPKTHPLPLPVEGGEVGHQERLPPLNRDYILPEVDDKGKCLFNVPKLFLDAMNGEAEVGGAELRKRVMELANIVQYRKYNDLLKQATEQKVIVRMERNHLTFYGPAPF